LPLRGVTTQRRSRNHDDDCAECETEERKVNQIEFNIEFDGPLTDEQRPQLLEVAEKCPAPRYLASGPVIRG
jgi:putative redox protein